MAAGVITFVKQMIDRSGLKVEGLLPRDARFRFTSVGEMELRGKEERVEIFGVRMNSDAGR